MYSVWYESGTNERGGEGVEDSSGGVERIGCGAGGILDGEEEGRVVEAEGCLGGDGLYGEFCNPILSVSNGWEMGEKH
jgi:hypothetical protein